MVRLAFAVACCLFAVGTAAQAQTTTVTGTERSFVNQSGPFTGKGVFPTDGGYANYASTISILPGPTDPTSISFESGNTVTGSSIHARSQTDVNLTLVNNANTAGTPTLHSRITPAGMGFYMADTSACAGSGGGPSTCAQSQGFATLTDLRGQANSILGGVNFDFTISLNESELYSVHGSMTLTANSDGFATLTTNLGDARRKLAGFTDVRLGNLGSALGYAWDATDVPMFQLQRLLPSEYEFVSYKVNVSSYSNGACLADGVTCLIAYASFGDPIGRGGGIDSLDAAPFLVSNLMTGLGLRDSSEEDPVRFINGVALGQTSIIPPTVTFDAGGVPEPATWISMIAGFGLLGAALRRRRVLAYT